jgi:protein arginine kinase activator
MKCQICNENIATIHLTEIENGVNKEIHLCEACYQDEKKNVIIEPTPSVEDLIKNLVKSIDTAAAQDENIRCTVCGTSYADFQKKGLFGCPQDYSVFKDSVIPLLEKIHGSTEHRGKVPKTAAGRRSNSEQLIILRKELESAIRNEMYEKAAGIRDEITKLES